ncbi:MAG: amidohydrolase family protein [Gammaproteobacteria bacterium]|nr:amidohydrolase family protein [Gammaproteobacteria bacterium]
MRNGYRVIDTDCHQIEPPQIWADYIDPEFADRAPASSDLGNGRKGMMVEGEPLAKQDGNYPMDAKEFLEATIKGMQRFERARSSGFNPASRLEDMDEQGVDAQVIYPTVGGQLLGKPFKDLDLLAACCRAYNDWSLEYCSAAPDKLLMAAMLPIQSPDLAIEEAHRASGKGASAFYIRPNPVEDRNYYHEDLDSLWAALEKIGKPICIHDSGSPHLPSYGDRMHTHTSGHIIAHPFEAMVAMMSLIWYGIIEKYPKLRIVHVEADAGWLPYWLQRMEQHFDFSGNAEHPLLKKRPTEYFKSNFLVACRGDEMTLPSVVELVGDDYITFNTDYPHPDGTWPSGFEALEKQPISEESIRKIFWDNAAGAFGVQANIN